MHLKTSLQTPHLFSIASGIPFMKTFVEALLSGELIEGYHSSGDPLIALADTIIYVPTRRAARALRSTLVELSPKQSSLLPTIRGLGDTDSDAVFFQQAGSEALTFNPPIGDIERLLLLTRLIRPWREKLPDHVRAMFGTEDVMVPTNTADAIWLSQDLAALMDEVETEEADWSKLHEIAPEMVAEWWQVTLDFLDIITTNWPEILNQKNMENPAAWRYKCIRAEAERLEKTKPNRPIIVAGSTGSIPAVAGLLKVIAHLPKGAVVLPGLDFDMDEIAWNSLDQIDHDPSIFGHPQYGLKKLLNLMGVNRSAICQIGQTTGLKQQRRNIVSQALRPANTTDFWANMQRDGYDEAFAKISLIEAANEREEALAIAIALRDAIEEPKKTAALITSDRILARRVVAELARFGVEANDSGGIPLSETLPATLLRLILESLFKPGDPVAFLSMLKHPLTNLQQNRVELRHRVENFEIFTLRGGTGRVNLMECDSFVEQRLAALLHNDYKSNDYSQKTIEDARNLATLLVKAVKPLVDLMKKSEPIRVEEAAIATTMVLENFGRDETNSCTILYHDEAGKAMIAFLRDLVSDQSGLTFDISEWPSIVMALLAVRSVSPSVGGHPRLSIWGAMEARLQTVDTIVIGGLNEGSWPTTQRNDPFMSRPMKMMLTLDPPERRTGIAAHDFQLAMGMDKVIMSRALRASNAPSVPSRWLQRLEAVIGHDVAKQLRHRGTKYLTWARQLDHAQNIAFVAQPCPKPPLNMRPKRFSVTEIETLRRDPYAIYAKKILCLKPLDDLIHDPSVAERGTLYHEILAAFSESQIDPCAPNALEKFLEIARAEFDKLQLPIDVEAIWWPRFEILAPAILDWEKTLSKRQRLVEIGARPTEIGSTGVELSGRADRIDILPQNHAEILDFKTGSTPSPKQAATLMAPQLALEAALLMRDAFEGCEGLTPSELLYIRLNGKGEVLEQRIAMTAKKPATELAEEAWARLGELVEYYQNENQGYLSRAMPALSNYEGDYDHLARVLEWSAGSDDDTENTGD